MFLVGSRVTFSHRTIFFFIFFLSEDLQNFSSNICQKKCSDVLNIITLKADDERPRSKYIHSAVEDV